MFQAECVPYALAERDRFRLDAAAFRVALAGAPRARMAVLNSPSNPTGGGGSRDAMRAIADACRERGVLPVSDEVYRDLHFGTRPASLFDVTSQGVVLSSVSKAFAAPGLRVGWAAGPPELLEPAAVVNGYSATAASHPCQGAALALLQQRDSVLPASRAEAAKRFAALKDALHRRLGLDVEPPDGTFYCWLPLPEHAFDDPVAFCVRVRDEGKVVLVPGLAFGERGRRFARLSFAASPEQLVEGVRRFAPYFRSP
jgi:aspartate/methionine/tyrosine aminotransferase